jgi:hypothetical protein
MKVIIFLIGIVVLAAAIFGLSFGSYQLYKYFAPKYAAVDREVFKESPSYNDGMIRDLENLMMEYRKADASHKEALKAVILHRFSIFPEEKMPPHIYAFYQLLKRGE